MYIPRARLMDTSYKCSVDEVTIALLNEHTNCTSSKNLRKQNLLAKFHKYKLPKAL